MLKLNEAVMIIPLCVMISGCAYHTQKTDFEVEQFGQSWMNQPFEQFIAYHPDVSNPLPIGNGSIRYEFEYDVETLGEVFMYAISNDRGDQYQDIYYKVYLFVNKEGTIYDIHIHRDSDTYIVR